MAPHNLPISFSYLHIFVPTIKELPVLFPDIWSLRLISRPSPSFSLTQEVLPDALPFAHQCLAWPPHPSIFLADAVWISCSPLPEGRVSPLGQRWSHSLSPAIQLAPRNICGFKEGPIEINHSPKANVLLKKAIRAFDPRKADPLPLRSLLSQRTRALFLESGLPRLRF